MRSPALSDIGETVTDALASSASVIGDFAVSAAARASDLASTAAEQLPDVPERLSELARTRLGTAKPARRMRPWMLLVAALTAALVVVWWSRRAPEHVADGGLDGATTGGQPSRIDTAASGR